MTDARGRFPKLILLLARLTRAGDAAIVAGLKTL